MQSLCIAACMSYIDNANTSDLFLYKFIHYYIAESKQAFQSERFNMVKCVVQGETYDALCLA